MLKGGGEEVVIGMFQGGTDWTCALQVPVPEAFTVEIL